MTITALVLLVTSCQAVGTSQQVSMSTPAEGGQIVSIEDALRLYGVDEEQQDVPEDRIRTPEPWFPMQVWVSASTLPYEDPDPVKVLPVFTDPDLGVLDTWVGDLRVGSPVVLWGIHANGLACYVVGETLQGWEIRGWVACRRLTFARPALEE